MKVHVIIKGITNTGATIFYQQICNVELSSLCINVNQIKMEQPRIVRVVIDIALPEGEIQ